MQVYIQNNQFLQQMNQQVEEEVPGPLLELRKQEVAWPESYSLGGRLDPPEAESPSSFFLQADSLWFVLVWPNFE